MNDGPFRYTQSTLDIAAAARKLSAVDRILVVTHAKPDGDAFGSAVALVATLRLLGKEARGLLVPPVPQALLDQRGAELADIYGPDTSLPFDPDFFVVVDTGAWSQLGPLRPLIEAHLDRTLILDHHLSGDIAAAHRYVDGAAAAACEVIAGLVDELLPAATSTDLSQPTAEGHAETMPWPAVIREALFIGIASDTGWFRFSNTRPQTLELAARLIRQGVDHADLYQRLEQAERPAKLGLLTRALQNLTLHAEDSIAVMVLRTNDFAETGARPEETERLVDTPQMVECIKIVVLVTESRTDDGRPQTRLSFRSKHAVGDAAVNVADLASRFGGGGHARAAGAKVDQPIDDVLAELHNILDELGTRPAPR